MHGLLATPATRSLALRLPSPASSHRRLTGVLAFLMAFCAATVPLSALSAEPLPKLPERRLMLTNLTLVRWNPLGLESQVRAGYLHQLYQRPDSAVLRDNFLYAGTFLRFNPASLRAAAVVELQPFSMLNLRATAEVLQFFGTFTFVQSRRTAADPWDDATLKASKTGPQGNYASSGVHLSFEPLIQAKLGPIAVRSRAFLGWFDVSLQRGDQVFYEATVDTLLPNRAWTFANDADVLTQIPMGEAVLTVGARWSAVRPLYRAEHVLATQDPEGMRNGHDRIGALIAYTLWDRGPSRFNRPTIVFNPAWYLDHRFRDGAAVSRAMPYLMLGFAFTADFLDVK